MSEAAKRPCTGATCNQTGHTPRPCVGGTRFCSWCLRRTLAQIRREHPETRPRERG